MIRQHKRRGKREGGKENKSPTPNSSFLIPRYRKSGFTLLEVLVALVIFGILTVALSNAMSVAMRTRLLAEQRQEDSATVRGVFSILGRDLQSAYGSVYDPNSLFTSGASGGSGGLGGASASGGALLTLATLSHPITTTDSNVDPSVDTSQTGSALGNVQNGSNDPPQQPLALVRYDLDPQSGTLSRFAQAVPNAQTLQQATPSPQDVLADNVVSLQLQFWDPTQQTWRDSWDFEQPNLPPSETAATTLNLEIANDMPTGTAVPTATVPTTGIPPGNNVNGAGGGSSGGGSAGAGTGNSDIGLPSAVQVTLVIRKKDGSQGTYTTILPIASHQLQDYPYVGGVTTNPNPQTTTTTGTGTGQ